MLRIVASVALVIGGCMDHSVGGKTAAEVFPDRITQKLVAGVCEGDRDAVSEAVKEGADPDARGLEGVTPVLWAISCESPSGLAALLANGADPNLGIEGRFKPVLVASTYENSLMLEELLNAGGDPNIVDGDHSQTPLYKAFATGMHKDNWSAYYLLLERGADIEFEDQVGGTIMHYAIAMGRFDKVIELLEMGYSKNLEEIAKRIEIRNVSPEFEEQYANKQSSLEIIEKKLAA